MVAFQTRCPECKAKLRFDEPPDAEEAIECPRCGHVFDAADAKAEPKKQKAIRSDDKPRKKKKKGEKEKKPAGPKKRKAKKKKANLFLLWIMLGGAVVFGPAIGWVGYKLFYSTGKMGELMAYVPGECNLLRGIDVTRLSKYPGYQTQLQSAMSGAFDECKTEFANATGEPADKVFDYAMSAKVRNGAASGAMLVFKTTNPVNATEFYKKLGGTERTIDGNLVHQLGAKPGVLANAYVYVGGEESRHIIVVVNQGDQMKMLKGSLAAKGDPKEKSMLPKLGTTGNKVCRANIWTLMLVNGDLKDKLVVEISDPLKAALSTLSQRVASAKMMGVWMYFGSSIKYGVAIECDSVDAAESLVKAMREGPLSKGDDSEIPRDLTSIFYVARLREFSEFMANLSFNRKEACAYLESKMVLEKSTQVLTIVNRTDMFEGPIVRPEGSGGRR